MIFSIVILHTYSVIIIEAPAALIELNNGEIFEIHIDYGVNLCVECDTKSTRKLREQYNVCKVIIVLNNLKREHQHSRSLSAALVTTVCVRS